MLELNNAQARIIEKFIEVYRNQSNIVTDGVTGYELDKLGNLAKLFRNHRKFLLDNYLIRLNQVEHHFTRHKMLFQVTRLGVLAHLKWMTMQEFKEIWHDRDFFPLLWKHWDKLVDIFGDILFDVLRKTINRIEVKPKMIIEYKGNRINDPNLIESIMIPLGKTEIKFFREYNSLIKQKIPDRIREGVEYLEFVNQEIDNKITERFSFLFYFNLLNHDIDIGEKMSIMIPDRVTFFNFEQELTNGIIETKKLEIEQFEKELHEKTNKLLFIIHKDKELHELMKNTISEIMTDLSNRKSLQITYERLNKFSE